MAVEEQLKRLANSCSRSSEFTRTLSLELMSSVRATQSALSVSRALLAQSDDTIGRIRMLTTGAEAMLAVDVQQNPPGAALETIRDRDFEHEFVVLDGRHFIDCKLSHCTLQYSGQPVILETTTFQGCRFEFRDGAALTVQLMECFELLFDANKLQISTSASPVTTRKQIN